MKARLRPALLATVLALAPVLGADSAPAAKKILFFSKSSGFEHSVISYRKGRPAYAEQVLAELGARNNLAFTFSKDGSRFTPAYLEGFDAFCFYTTGDLTTAGLDKNPSVTPAGKAALLEAIAQGKGFIGIHSATDTFFSPGNEMIGSPARYKNDGERTDPYIRMIGGEFIKHDDQQKARLTVADPGFPGMAAVPADFNLMEEWYSLKNFPSDLHVLLVQETAGMTGLSYQRAPYPATWARMHGKGRVFYTSMGHREDVWLNPVFQAVLLGGLNWATGRAEADITPNLARVTPKANELPPYPDPTRKQ
ncbi:MAG: ThuA domain-containing protein [Pseudomonadota bacterium]